MKLVVLILLLLTLATATNYQQVGGEFGQNMIDEFKTEDQAWASPNSNGTLWDWGSVPKGKSIQDGKPIDANFTPAMLAALNWMQAMGYSNPVIMNSTNPHGNFSQTIGQVSDDPWMMAQHLGRPVMANNTLYYPAF
jgi:hypothetical protein